MTRLIRTILWPVAAFVFVLLVLRDVQPDGALDIHTDFRRPTPYVSLLGPPTRVDFRDSDLLVVAEPVYFDLRLPRWFATATLRLSYTTEATSTPTLGVWLDPLHPDRPDAPIALLPTVNGVAELNLKKYPRSRYGHRLFIAASGVTSSTPLVIYSLDVYATR